MRRAYGSAVMFSLLVAGLASQALAAGHYEMVWFRMWDHSENGQAASCIGVHVFQVWVFDESGNRMGNVQILDQDGAYLGSTAANGERCEIPLIQPSSGGKDIAVRCTDGSGSTSDISPVVTVQVPDCWGHYSYDAGFVFKTDGGSPGQADQTLIGDLPQQGDTADDYTNPYTRSMVYTHQKATGRYLDAPVWQLLPNGGTRLSQSFVTTGINRILGTFLFPVQPGNAPTLWKAEVHYGGADGPIVCTKSQPVQYYFAQPLAFGVNACPVVPNATYTVTLIPISPSACNAYYYPGTNYANGQMYVDGVADAGKDMFGFVWGWDAGVGTTGMILGTVRDTNAHPIRNATVTLSGGPTSGNAETSDSGVYIFPAVLPGTYTVSVDRPGYEAASSGGHVVQVDQVTLVDFTLSPLVQELSNVSFEMGDYAWTGYGAVPLQLWQNGVAAISSPYGSYWLGTLYPNPTGAGGIYQRVPTLAGESYQTVMNAYTVSSGQVRIGVDAAGGTDPDAATWSAWSSSSGAWSADSDTNKRVSFTASGALATVFVEASAPSSFSAVAVDNVRLYRSTGPAPESQDTLSAGWALVSAPLVAAAGEPVTSVFDEVIAAGNNLNNNLARYNTGVAGNYDYYSASFTAVSQTLGYWMNLGTAATETMSGALPADPVSMTLNQGWNLIGQPHRFGTPLSGLVLVDGNTPAWHDDVTDKCKYRSDGPWTWLNDAETVIEWGVYVNKRGYTDGYPRIKFREDAEVIFSYDENNGWWSLPGTRTAGGVNLGGAYRVLMAPNSWHTVRAYLNGATMVWSLTIDGLTDAAHHVEGVGGSGSGGSGYVQFGVVSSPKKADFYTSHVYWGQNSEIDNWPTSKKYDASASHMGPDFAYGAFLGWGKEISGTTRSYTSIGSVQKKMAEAAAAGWVENAAVGYDGGYRVVQTAGGDDTSLRAWQGYWLKVNQTGLSVRIPAPAEAGSTADDTVSKVRLNLNAPGCITGNFIAAMSPTAADGYEAAKDVTAPPAGPAAQREVRLATTLNSSLMLQDVRLAPAADVTKVWNAAVQPVNFTGGECKTVTVTWDVDQAAPYSYTLVDLGQAVSTPMLAGDSYTFEICQGQSPAFEIRATEKFSRVDYNRDTHVDGEDYERFKLCATGPGIIQPESTCLDDADLDGDGDVDQTDFAGFQMCYSGAGPADPDCP